LKKGFCLEEAKKELGMFDGEDEEELPSSDNSRERLLRGGRILKLPYQEEKKLQFPRERKSLFSLSGKEKYCK